MTKPPWSDAENDLIVASDFAIVAGDFSGELSLSADGISIVQLN
jgi:hypothetical protein